MEITIPDNVRATHVYMPGKTQHGKSTLMFWMLLQDITRGNGACLMDGKGDFAPEFLNWIPENRKDDAIYLDIDTPVPLDFMGYHGEREKEVVIAELRYILTRSVETQYAPLMNANITDLLYTLFNYNENSKTPPHCRATFLDIFNFLDDPERRDVILNRVTDEALQRRWRDNFPNPVERSRITTRMTSFVRSETLSKIFGTKQPRLNLAEIMDKRKILIVNLGPIDDIKKTYGTLLLSKIRQAAMRRAAIPKSQRVPFYLYCDEFQEFQTSDFDKLLSLAGGLGLCLTLAHQYTDQLESNVLSAILGNVSTFICFRLGQPSANCLRGEIPKDYLPCLTTLPVGQVVYRAADGSTTTLHTPVPPTFPHASYAEIIRNRTVDNYGCNTSPVCSTKEDGNRTPPSDEIKPTGPPNVPSHGGKKKDA